MPRDSDTAVIPAPAAGVRDSANVGHLLTALAHRRCVSTPYDYWLLSDLLPAPMVDAIGRLPFPAPPASGFDGRRETNNSSRHYFCPATRRAAPVIGDVIDLFSDAAIVEALSALTGVDLKTGRLRVEYCQDVDGFWLEPHVDISAKLMTLLVYVSDDPRLADAGTDVYDAGGEKLGNIHDVMLNEISDKIEFAILNFGGHFVGVNQRFFPLPWHLLQFDEARRAYVINIDRKSRGINLSIKAKDAVETQSAMQKLATDSSAATGTTNLGALLKAKLDGQSQ